MQNSTITSVATARDGSDIQQVTIARGDVTATLITWGASLQDLRLSGVAHGFALGSPDALDYTGPMRHFGSIVGPVANRIAGGRLVLNGQDIQLEQSEAATGNCLHGGSTGFSKRNWTLVEADAQTATFAITHDDGLGNFPGTIEARARYEIAEDGALVLELTGTSDRETWFAPAFHGYWNLDGSDDLSGHRLTVMAGTYLPVDAAQIPLGAPEPVAETKFDYRTPRAPEPDLDHNFCLSHEQGSMRTACVVEAGEFRLTVETTEVGLQVYSGGNLNTAPTTGHHGKPYTPNAGIAIEPQFWPDTPNHPDYPSAAIAPGQPYRQVSRFHVTRTP